MERLESLVWNSGAGGDVVVPDCFVRNGKNAEYQASGD